MKIEILGPGCWRCKQVEANVRRALQELKVDAKIEKITDFAKITEKVSMTPGLVIDGKIKAEGRIPEVEEIKKWLEK